LSSAHELAAHPIAEVAPLLLPALVSREVRAIAEQSAREQGRADRARNLERHISALTGRLLAPGGWASGARRATAEPSSTGRARPYDESTLRKSARRMSADGASRVVEQQLEAQVRSAVGAQSVTAYTDMYDQVYWTKKLAYAAPIGALGNRLLAATYFGMTFVRPTEGPLLAYHLSWHKPASPLFDALDVLHARPSRHRWLTAHVGLHILDRGTQGDTVLQWCVERRIPYLTLSNGVMHWRRYKNPTHHTPTGVPIFVRTDRRLVDVKISSAVRSTPPRTIVFPARPDKGEASVRSIRYRTAAKLSDAQIESLDELYKSRWPDNENPIKALVAVGFGVNRDRTLDVTTSRGLDGELARAKQAITKRDVAIRSLDRRDDRDAERERNKLLRKQTIARRKLRSLDRKAARVEKGARSNRGGEMLCKLLTLLLFNALALLLSRSAIHAVRMMTPHRVRELLLGRAAMARVEREHVILVVEPIFEPTDRDHQAELVRLFNAERLQIRGMSVNLRVRDPTSHNAPLRIAA
jgi:hypothetical protein